MPTTATHRDGTMEDGSLAVIRALIAELDGDPDPEHPDVSLSDDETGWTLSAFPDGLVVWENIEDDGVEPQHLVGITRDDLVVMMELLRNGDHEQIATRPWRSGYGS